MYKLLCLQNSVFRYHSLESIPFKSSFVLCNLPLQYRINSFARFIFSDSSSIPIVSFSRPSTMFCNSVMASSYVIIMRQCDNEEKILSHYYQRIIAAPQVNPLPNAARQTKSPSFIKPFSHASQSAIGIDAAVVLPYF